MQPHFMLSSSSEASDSGYRRPESLSPNQMRVPLRRDRTPIQRNRRSIPRARSSSRTEMLLPYATEQLNLSNTPPSQAGLTVVPSQSAPTTPQVFPMPNTYTSNPGPTSSSYTTTSGYFPPSFGQVETQSMQHYDYQGDQQFDDFYMVTRPTSTTAGMSELPPNEGFLPHDMQHGVGAVTAMPPGMTGYAPISAPLESSGGHGDVAIMPSRPKPQCWDHGCNGRQFSTFSNLLRHQRERSGSAMKAICPYCGTEFTRTTARNGHMYGGKCRAKESSEPSPQGSSKSS